MSIGLPVFNGENYLADAVDSILGQTFEDFELIISDNASTDGTAEIVQSFACRDSRVRYFRNDKNLGAAKNYNRTYELSSGEYFKWAAHDDVLDKHYIAKCVDILDEDDTVVLCHSKTKFIDETGKEFRDFETILKNLSSKRPQARFGDLILIDHWCFHIFGLMRSRILEKTPLLLSYPAHDRILLARLSLMGRIHEIPEFLFYSREHPQRAIRAHHNRHAMASWFDPANAGALIFPDWRILGEFSKAVMEVPLTSDERRSCYAKLVRYPMKNFNWVCLLADIIIAVFPRMARPCWDIIYNGRFGLAALSVVKKNFGN